MKLPKDSLTSTNAALYSRLSLTRGEAAIIDLLMTGLKTRRILEETGLSLQGLKYHKTNIYRKLKLTENTTPNLVARILNEGYIFSQSTLESMVNLGQLPTGACK